MDAVKKMEEKTEKPEWVGKKKIKKEKFIDLTAREEAILIQLKTATISVIASRLGIEKSTVRSYKSRMLKKMADAQNFLNKMKPYKKLLKKE